MVDVVLKRVYHKGHICFELPDDVYIRESIRKLLAACQAKHNDYVRLVLQRPRKKRSTGDKSQNHHLNGHIMQICAETGNDYESVKYAVKMTAIEQYGYPYETIAGHIVPKGERDTDTAECAMLIEAAHYIAADLGIILREE